MKKIKIIICIGFIIMISVIFIYNKQNTMKIKIKKGTLTNTGATLIVINNHKQKYSYNNDLKIYEKKGNKWEEVELKEGKHHFTNTIAMSNESKICEFTADWSNLYGELKKGKYKLVKRYRIEGKEKAVSVKFAIK